MTWLYQLEYTTTSGTTNRAYLMDEVTTMRSVALICQLLLLSDKCATYSPYPASAQRSGARIFGSGFANISLSRLPMAPLIS